MPVYVEIEYDGVNPSWEKEIKKVAVTFAAKEFGHAENFNMSKQISNIFYGFGSNTSANRFVEVLTSAFGNKLRFSVGNQAS